MDVNRPAARTLKADLMRLFSNGHEVDLPERPLGITAPVTGPGTAEQGQTVSLDLTGKPRIVMCFGAGKTGKSTLLRWAVERAIERDDGEDLALATLDVLRPTLKQFFPETMMPSSREGTLSWLERLLGRLFEARTSAAIDFGADASVLPLLDHQGDLGRMAADAGVTLVALHLLSPRVSDLSLLSALEQAGFQPEATGLVLNMGTAVARDRAEVMAEFALLRRHSAYRAVLERNGAEIWMPRLVAASAVENRCIGFRIAMEPGLGSGAMPALNLFDRSRVRGWLDQMETAFAPIASWLP